MSGMGSKPEKVLSGRHIYDEEVTSQVRRIITIAVLVGMVTMVVISALPGK